MATGLQAWVDNHAIGFETVPFMIVGRGQWLAAGKVIQFEIPGSNRTITQHMGLGPYKVAYELKLASLDDYRALQLLQGSEGTLTLFPDTAGLPTTTVIIAGQRYERVTAVLALLGDPLWSRAAVECTATFTVDAAD